MPWRTRIVGRGREIAELDGQWQRAAAGEFRFVLVIGEPGMGKTRLAAEALEDRRRASIELSARAHPLGDTASFGLWVEALERHLRTLAKPDVAALCGGFLDDLASLLRSVAVVRGAAPDREPPRPRLLEGLAVLLANLAEQAAASHFPTTSAAGAMGRASRMSRWRLRHSSATRRLVTIGAVTISTKARLGNQNRRLASREPSATTKKIVPVSTRKMAATP